MRTSSIALGAAAIAATLCFAASPARAQKPGPANAALRRAEDEVARLRVELSRVNADVADLKHADRSVRNDYRLRERMADAEAIAQRLMQAEARARSLGAAPPPPRESSPLSLPQPTPQDGSLELEAKADLLADQALRLDHQADALDRAASELRARRLLRRKASAWDRDPFAGLESSKRNLAIAAPATKTAVPIGSTTTEGTRGTTPPPLTPTVGAVNGPTPTGTAGGGVAGITQDTGKAPTFATSSEAAAGAKASPLVPGDTTLRQSLDQRFYLDPTTAAELRQVLSASGAGSDPEALTRAAAALRARARKLNEQSQSLLQRSRMP
jgi:hypothetical protein